MEEWKITKRDLEQLVSIQRKLGAMRERYAAKAGVDEYGCTESRVANELDCASASLEMILERNIK